MIFAGCAFPRQCRNKRWVRWETEWSFDGKLCQEYLYQKLSKFDNWFSSYSQKCCGCFFETQCITVTLNCNYTKSFLCSAFCMRALSTKKLDEYRTDEYRKKVILTFIYNTDITEMSVLKLDYKTMGYCYR